MTMKQLTERTGITARQVRYMIAEGFVPPPSGGRANAEYGDAHLSAVQRYQRLRAAGFSPASIRLLLDTQTGVPFEVLPGISLVVNPALIASGKLPEDLQTHIQSVLDRIISPIKKEDSNDS